MKKNLCLKFFFYFGDVMKRERERERKRSLPLTILIKPRPFCRCPPPPPSDQVQPTTPRGPPSNITIVYLGWWGGLVGQPNLFYLSLPGSIYLSYQHINTHLQQKNTRKRAMMISVLCTDPDTNDFRERL